MLRLNDLDICLLKDKPKFLNICVQWSYDEWGKHVEGCTLSEMKKTYVSRLTGDGLPLMWIALKDDVAVGMVGLKKHGHSERENLSPWLSSLYVDEQYRGRGLAQFLIEHTKQQAKIMGYRNIHLYTSVSSSFYTHNGWEHIGYVTDPMNTKRKAALYAQELS